MTWLMSNVKAALAGAAVLLVGLAVFFIRKSGGDAERARQAGVDLKAANTIAAERAKAKAATTNDHDRSISKWTRKP